MQVCKSLLKKYRSSLTLFNFLVEINFVSTYSALIVKWNPGNSCLATIEYIGYWTTILHAIELYCPSCLLIDATNLEYRTIADVNLIFNEISLRLKPQNIAIVKSTNLLGSITVDNLLHNSQLLGFSLFTNFAESIVWLESYRLGGQNKS